MFFDSFSSFPIIFLPNYSYDLQHSGNVLFIDPFLGEFELYRYTITFYVRVLFLKPTTKNVNDSNVRLKLATDSTHISIPNIPGLLQPPKKKKDAKR